MLNKEIIKNFNPVQFFQSWSFEIHKAHWSAFGINLREYIDKEKTKNLREKWIKSNPRYEELSPIFFNKKLKSVENLPEYDEWTKLKQRRTEIKITKMAYGKPRSISASLEFHEGDVFYLRGHNKKIGLQLICDGDPLEVMFFDLTNSQPSVGYHIPPYVLLHWLKTGEVPDSSKIKPNQSKSELAKFNEYR